jgi:peptidoglycan/LPS O-acetylase OafA/YrhL
MATIGTRNSRVATNDQSGYRPDIDGLRAVAVIAVMLFHIDLPNIAVPGGFTGVDVFFVISGYLITQILLNDSGNGRLKRFWVRRFWRIFPALFVVVAASLIAGHFWLIPDEYGTLAGSARYALFALSNWYFYVNTGYFDQAAELMPLLHTWSLAVEEQFYLVWPLLILAVGAGRSRWALPLIVAGLALASIAYAEYLVREDSKAAFYHPLARAWELALGGLIACLPKRAIGKIWAQGIDVCGAALIGVSLFALGETDPFPGLNAAFACVGTALLLLPKERSIVARGLSLAPVRGIGLISYSLYLWHWPILVFALHATDHDLDAAQSWGVLAASFLFAFFSWRYVEQPLRKPAERRRYHAPLAAATMLVLTASATVIFTSGGLKGRLPVHALSISDRDSMWAWKPQNANPDQLGGFVTLGDDWENADYRIVLWGDSHAAHLAPLIDSRLLAQPSTSVALYQSCAPHIDGVDTQIRKQTAQYNDACRAARSTLVGFLERETVDAVVLAAAWASSVRMIAPGSRADTGIEILHDSLARTVDAIRQHVPDIAIVGQIPSWRIDPIPCALAYLAEFHTGRCDGRLPVIAVDGLYDTHFASDAVIEEIANAASGVTAHPLTDRMCTDSHCLSFWEDEFLYMDEGHLRRNLPIDVRAALAERLDLDAVLGNGAGKLAARD